MALFSLALCKIGGASGTAMLLLPTMFLVISAVTINCSPKIAKVLVCIWSGLAPFITVFTCQLLLNESTLLLGVQKILLNMAICGIVICLIYILTARLRVSVIVGMSGLLFFTAANYFVFMFRGSELCPADFLSIGTAAAVADRYTFSIDAPFVYAIILAMLFVFAVFCITIKQQRKKQIKKRIIGAISLIVLVIGLMIGSENITANHFLQTGSVNNGYFLNFVLEIEESIINKPDGYSNEIVRTLAEKYEESLEVTKQVDLPVIITIMNESFADLSVLGNEIDTNIDVLPFFSSLKDNTVRGYALSSVIGGGTANSEYEFLSGNTMGFLPAGSIVYQQFIYENPYTFISYMNKLGYTTVATHPESGKNWLRDSVYPEMGFDEMYFMEDYPYGDLVRGFVSDQEMYERIIERYEDCSTNETLFLFGISMQNHGFYDYEGDDFENEVYLNGYSGSYPDVEQYLTVLHESDKAVEYLIDYFKKVDRDVVILFYGDHHPKLDAEFYEEVHGGSFDSLDEQMAQYTVPFFIWTNYDIEEQYIELTSLNYLSNFLFDVAGIDFPAYNQFLANVQDVIPAMNSFGYYSKEKGKFLPYDEATGLEAEMLQKYQMLQYNCMFDKENISEIFFSVHSD